VRAVLRAALCVVFPLGLLWCALSRHRRSLQDLVVGSAVVYDGVGSGRTDPPPAGALVRGQPVHPARMGRAAPRPDDGGRPSAEEASP
jgi:hypothetical protein